MRTIKKKKKKNVQKRKRDDNEDGEKCQAEKFQSEDISGRVPVSVQRVAGSTDGIEKFRRNRETGRVRAAAITWQKRMAGKRSGRTGTGFSLVRSSG